MNQVDLPKEKLMNTIGHLQMDYEIVKEYMEDLFMQNVVCDDGECKMNYVWFCELSDGKKFHLLRKIIFFLRRMEFEIRSAQINKLIDRLLSGDTKSTLAGCEFRIKDGEIICTITSPIQPRSS